MDITVICYEHIIYIKLSNDNDVLTLAVLVSILTKISNVKITKIQQH